MLSEIGVQIYTNKIDQFKVIKWLLVTFNLTPKSFKLRGNNKSFKGSHRDADGYKNIRVLRVVHYLH